MDLAMTSDYESSQGDPAPHLRRIAEAGFTHVHWCHEWNSDHEYSPSEITTIGRMLSELGLQLQDLHASHGVGKSWVALDEDRRCAGVGLVENRIVMAASLSSRVIILHLPEKPTGSIRGQRYRAALYRSLAELEPIARRHDVRIAIENMAADDFADIRDLFAHQAPEFLGLCYDSGHGNIGGQGLDYLERHKDRLLAVHLHDNDGAFDLHSLPFTGTVDWARLARLISESAYRGCVSLESNLRGVSMDSGLFLAEARAAAVRLARMISGEEPHGSAT